MPIINNQVRPHRVSIYLIRPKKDGTNHRNLAESSRMLPRRHFGWPLVRRETQCGLLTEWLIYDFFTRCAVNLLPAGTDDDGNAHFGKPLRRRCRRGAASGVCLVSPDLALFGCGYSLGIGSEPDRLGNHRDEFCRLSLPSTRLFGRPGAEFPHCCRETKPTRAPATGSPICSIGDPSDGISVDRTALAFLTCGQVQAARPPTNRPSGHI